MPLVPFLVKEKIFFVLTFLHRFIKTLGKQKKILQAANSAILLPYYYYKADMQREGLKKTLYFYPHLVNNAYPQNVD